MKLKADQRRVSGKLKRLKPRFGVFPTRVQDNPKAYRRHPKHREAVSDTDNKEPL
ncbi:hypothetical protein HF290_03035 [Acidithiobacillus ferrooxidans]|uniref:hypothetical protein n=1 Tax=Acidithiobacillus ferrooxidans TaxID=920 RepID=UPI001C066AC2|nr:hypothetical protein [Acidithiobacillus ferrooxidans]MBU2859422.1 hypothetical protein [Acidithiobacillus ferrooxidans]